MATTARHRFHALHNCDITNWGSYGIYCGSNADQFIALLGTAIHQHEEAMMGGGQRRKERHQPARADPHQQWRTYAYLGVRPVFAQWLVDRRGRPRRSALPALVHQPR
jgi:hypothetical protein